MPTPTSIRFEQDAERWDKNGRALDQAFDSWYAVTLNCWCGSSGAKKEGYSEILEAYRSALMKELDRKQPNWMDDMFDGREFCKVCGTSWRSENMSFCTHCGETYPPCHRPDVFAANGNLDCSKCHKGEIVG
jgi:hypothetical protein